MLDGEKNNANVKQLIKSKSIKYKSKSGRKSEIYIRDIYFITFKKGGKKQQKRLALLA